MSIAAHENLASAYRSREVSPPARVHDGVWAIPVPLHGSPLRSIIVYLVESSEGLVLIDAGYQHPSCWDSFTQSVQGIGHAVEDVRAVFLTHNHPDHVGFADRVRDRSGAQVVMHQRDDFGFMHRTRGRFLDQLDRALVASGAPEDVVDRMREEAAKVAHHAESLAVDTVAADTEFTFGDVTIRAVPTPGHTYGHLSFTARGAVFTGDTLMPEGPTQLAIPSLREDNPIGDLLGTLDTLASLPVEIACPAHQYPYRNLARRAQELRDHHAAELARVSVLARTYDTAWEIAPHLVWSRPWEELGSGTRRFALMHTLALLHGVER